MASRPPVPRTFYLNEQHELSRGEKEGGGRVPLYTGVDWAAKGRDISKSLRTARTEIQASKDPLRGQHYFLLTRPVDEVRKKSKNKRIAPTGEISEKIRFSGEDSQVFRRLGVDLIDVTDEGEAIVHMSPERLSQLAATGNALAQMGLREQARWASIQSFTVIPPELRLAESWLESLPPRQVTDAVVEFQPLLRRSNVEELIRAIAALLRDDQREGFANIGVDFSGRHWARGKITPETLRAIARTFYSVQTLHSPLLSIAAGPRRTGPVRLPPIRVEPRVRDIASLPTVGILDTGVPAQHRVLAPYRRGSYVAPDSYGSAVGDHGSFVASRVVFGDLDSGDGAPQAPPGECQYYDVLVATSLRDIDNKSVTRSIESVVANAPDVRVFNLSFDTPPLEQLDFTQRRENLLLVQDLDNLIFRDDVLLVVSAGNSPAGVQPDTAYPANYDDPLWQLGAWARSFNALTCGSLVGRLSPGGLASGADWPSPFTRVGPGLCDSPKPDFAAPGGNVNSGMRFSPGLGVWGLTGSGLWEDRAGTSFAAPVLAREAAFAFQALQKMCQQGARPYAVVAKAFLFLTARQPQVPRAVQMLTDRALGRGIASARRLERPVQESAILIWQGMLQDQSDIARVEIPIPKDWYNAAENPRMHVVVCWDPPVNAAADDIWSTRRVSAHLKANPDSKSLHGTRRGHGSYPCIAREYDLRRLPDDISIDGDLWLLELSYEQIADYHPAMTFSPQQRVAFAAELYDGGPEGISPQVALQAMPRALTMTRLSVPPLTVTTPVIIRSPG